LMVAYPASLGCASAAVATATSCRPEPAAEVRRSPGSAKSRRIPGAGLFRALQLPKRRLGNERGAKLAQIEVARRLTYAIWHILTNNEPFDAAAPGGAAFRLAA
jgi:hypothetical protein